MTPYQKDCSSLFNLVFPSHRNQSSTTASNEPPATLVLHGNCSVTPFSTEFQNSALFSHNHFRSLVARGLAENGMYVRVNAPTAARMSLMYYDCAAEYFAFKHVKSCDKNLPPEGGFEENIHIFETDASLDESSVVQRAIDTWASELKDHGIPLIMKFTPEASQYKKRVTSVTKILWGTNSYVGCATQKCDGFYFTSCMYYYGVNVVGKNIYNIGRTCNECPSMDKCISLEGLCPWY